MLRYPTCGLLSYYAVFVLECTGIFYDLVDLMFPVLDVPRLIFFLLVRMDVCFIRDRAVRYNRSSALRASSSYSSVNINNEDQGTGMHRTQLLL